MKKRYVMRILCAGAITLFCFPVFAQFPSSDSTFYFESEKTISLDLKGMDVVEVLKTLASKGDMNLVIGSNVRGRVTMFLEDVNIEDAFEIILLANNLASDKRGDIVYVMTQRDYEQLYGAKYGDKKEAKIIQLKYAKATAVNKVLSQLKTKIGKIIVDEGSNTVVIIDSPQAVSQAVELVEKLDKPTTTKIFELNYASVGDVQDKIQDLITKEVGSIQIDERTNKIVVTDLKEKVDEIEKVLEAFDDRQQQVLIEAKIVEITLSDEFKLGVNWEAIFNDLQNRLWPTVKHPITLQTEFNLSTGSGQFPPGAQFRIGTVGTSDYGILVQALKKLGDVNTLSSPRITVLNNEEAKILVGSNEPYAINAVTQGTSTTTTASELKFLEIGVKLFVTPTINRDGFISVKIRPEVSSKSGTYTYGDPETSVPIVSTTNAETNVMVKDGATIIIGGLIKDERNDSEDKVPVFGDIPLLGTAFKRIDKTTVKKELVIFITPSIISGEVDYIDVPPSPPVGEKRFTTRAEPAFEKRKPREMNPEYLIEEDKDKKPVKKSGSYLDLKNASPDEYFSAIKAMVTENLSLPEKEARLSKDDRVTVSFSLFSGGHLASRPKMVESTNSYLSVAVIEAIKNTAPFPAFPLSIKEFKKEFTLEIVYEPNPSYGTGQGEPVRLKKGGY